MAWLIRKKSILLGEVEQSERILRQLPEEIRSKRAEITTLDLFIPLHQVVVDPVAIKATRKK